MRHLLPRSGLFSALALGLALLTPGVVRADPPVVVVHVAGSTAGVTVTLTDGSGQAHSCSTDDTGSCELTGVVAGRATVTAQSGGSPSPSRSVYIPADPPDGKVSLIVPRP